VKNDRHQDALNSFNKAVALQQQYRLPEDRVVRKLSKDYQNLGDERFRVNIRPPVMRDMMDIPLKYYQLAEALHSTPYLKKKIEECKRLQRP
ncbi:hypothetical protein, partial [Spirosoma sp.]|uniref:hypothetical protein n=1 Tax=Spirosoma sp. TaxID=1899569 RepID=UPI003B3B5F66